MEQENCIIYSSVELVALHICIIVWLPCQHLRTVSGATLKDSLQKLFFFFFFFFFMVYLLLFFFLFFFFLMWEIVISQTVYGSGLYKKQQKKPKNF